MEPIYVTIGGERFDLMPVQEAVAWAFDFSCGQDLHFAARNCQPMRHSPLTDQLEQAASLLNEMHARQTRWVRENTL